MSLRDCLPESTDDLLALAPEVLGEAILRFACSLTTDQEPYQLSPAILLQAHHLGSFPDDKTKRQVDYAFMEAWGWLEREVLIALSPRPVRGVVSYFVTRRGRLLGADPDARLWTVRFSQHRLHAAIASCARGDFLERNFDAAVLKAFKEVEIAVREAAKLGPEDFGHVLMRKAFDPEKGELRDPTVVPAEREATAALFAGAIGLFKNPHSHRRLGLSDPDRALELLMFASFLMYHVEDRSKKESEDGTT